MNDCIFEYDIIFSSPKDEMTMDESLKNICKAMNGIPGMRTIESCCGHEKERTRIWFRSEDFKGLFFFTRSCDKRYWKHGKEWSINLTAGDKIVDGIIPNDFCFESNEVLSENDLDEHLSSLIKNMNEHYESDAFMNYFDIDRSKFIVKNDKK